MPESTIEQFLEYFELKLASTEALRERCHRLRYEVYVREFGFEREEDCPGKLERDDYDGQALHMLLIHRASGLAAGSVRLVLNDAAQPERRLPFWEHCGETLHADHRLHPQRQPPGKICEVSRLAVIDTFRRREGERESPIGRIEGEDFSDLERRTFPLISLALFMASTSLSLHTGCDHDYAMMEPRLARRLARSALHFDQIGREADYHGIRAAFYISPHEARASVSRVTMLEALFKAVDGALEAQLAANPGTVG